MSDADAYRQYINNRINNSKNNWEKISYHDIVNACHPQKPNDVSKNVGRILAEFYNSTTDEISTYTRDGKFHKKGEKHDLNEGSTATWVKFKIPRP